MSIAGETAISGAIAFFVTAVVVGVIWHRRYFTEVSVAGRTALRASLPSWLQWLMPRHFTSPWFLNFQLVFGVAIGAIVATCFWVAFVAGVVEIFRAGGR